MTVRNTRTEQLRRAGLDPSKVKDEKLPPPEKTETKISLEIRTWLEKKIGALPTRVNSGMLKVGTRWIHLAPKGTSDSLILLPIQTTIGLIGIYLAIEVKKPSNKPTPEQVRFIAKVLARGGIAFYATSRDDAAQQLFAEVLRRFGPAALIALEKGFQDEPI